METITHNQAKPANYLSRMFQALYHPSGSKDKHTVIDIDDEPYNVIYHYDNRTKELELKSIDCHTDIEFTYTEQFLFKLENKIREEITSEDDHSDESRGN